MKKARSLHKYAKKGKYTTIPTSKYILAIFHQRDRKIPVTIIGVLYDIFVTGLKAVLQDLEIVII